jgi:hypothetical protein
MLDSIELGINFANKTIEGRFDIARYIVSVIVEVRATKRRGDIPKVTFNTNSKVPTCPRQLINIAKASRHLSS